MTTKTAIETDLLTEAAIDEVKNERKFDHAMLTVLQKMVAVGDVEPSVFLNAARSIDWAKKSADFYNAALRLVFNAGAYQFARELSARALTQYPDDERLKQWATVLAPPKVVGTEPVNPTIGDTMRWLQEHGAEYRGCWVAVNAGQLLDQDANRNSLVDRLGEQATHADTFVVRIP